jgi:hypothetical protein
MKSGFLFLMALACASLLLSGHALAARKPVQGYPYRYHKVELTYARKIMRHRKLAAINNPPFVAILAHETRGDYVIFGKRENQGVSLLQAVRTEFPIKELTHFKLNEWPGPHGTKTYNFQFGWKDPKGNPGEIGL